MQIADCFVNPAAKLELLPHIRRSKAITYEFEQASRGVCIASAFQHSHESATPMTDERGGILGKVIECHSQMFSIMLFASVAQHFVFGDGASSLFGPVPKQNSSTAMPASPPLSTFASGALLSLKVAVNQFAAFCTDDLVRQVDDGHYNLVRTFSFCQSWVSQIEAYMTGCITHNFHSAAQHLHRLTEQLDSSVPRWDALFAPSAEIDWDLVSTRILQHPRRLDVPILVKHIQKLKRDLDALATNTGAETKVESGISGFVSQHSGPLRTSSSSPPLSTPLSCRSPPRRSSPHRTFWTSSARAIWTSPTASRWPSSSAPSARKSPR